MTNAEYHSLVRRVLVLERKIAAVAVESGTPDAHATSHQNGGSDELNVAGLSGVLADSQTVSVDAAGALSGTGAVGNPLAVLVDGVTIDIVGNELVALGGGSPGGGSPEEDSAEEIDYIEFTANVSPTATTEATANTVVTGSPVTYDGVTVVMIEFFCVNARPDVANGASISFWLYDGSSSIGRIGFISASAALGGQNVPVRLARRLKPSAATHTYSIRASVSGGTGLVTGGAGGLGNTMPGFIRITEVH